MNRFRALLDSLTPAQITLVLAVAWGSAIVALILALWLRRRNRLRMRPLQGVCEDVPSWSWDWGAQRNNLARYRKD